MRHLFSVAILLLAGTAVAEEIPATEFARPMEFHNAVLSPTGEYIAVQRSADDGKQLVAIVVRNIRINNNKGFVTFHLPSFWL